MCLRDGCNIPNWDTWRLYYNYIRYSRWQETQKYSHCPTGIGRKAPGRYRIRLFAWWVTRTYPAIYEGARWNHSTYNFQPSCEQKNRTTAWRISSDDCWAKGKRRAVASKCWRNARYARGIAAFEWKVGYASQWSRERPKTPALSAS